MGGKLDRDQWTTILEIVSAKTAYRHLYREALKPWLVADMLIFRRELPRSLAWTAEQTVDLLGEFGSRSGRQGPADRLARQRLARLDELDVSTIFPQRSAPVAAGLCAGEQRPRRRDRRPVPVRLRSPDASLHQPPHPLYLFGAHPTRHPAAAQTPVELRRPVGDRLAGRRGLPMRGCGRAATGTGTSRACSTSTSRAHLAVSVTGRVLTEDHAGVVVGLPTTSAAGLLPARPADRSGARARPRSPSVAPGRILRSTGSIG